MPRLSIIIPLTGQPAPFEETLISVLENRPPNCEVLVVYAGSYDDPYDLQDEVRLVGGAQDGGAVELINTGLRAARGEIVHVLPSGLRATPDWTDRMWAQFDAPDVGAVAPVIVHQQDASRVVAAGVCYTAAGSRRLCGARCRISGRRLGKLRPHGPALMAGFYRRHVLQLLGGWQASVGYQLADVDLAMGLRACGYRTTLDPDSRLVADDHLQRHPRPSFRSGRQRQRVLLHHARTIGWWKVALSAPPAWMLETLVNLPRLGALTQLFGRAAACCELREQSRYRRQLEQAAAALARVPVSESSCPRRAA